MANRKKSHDKSNRVFHAWQGVFLPRAPRLGVLAGIAIVVLAVFLSYYPSLNGEFIWDDELLLTNNLLVKASDGLYRIWCTTESYDYWPMTNTMFWIEWRLWGLKSTGYHVTNLVLHIFASLLIWTILRKLSIPGAFLAAVIFAVHPVNVESVAWIAQRKNTLAMVFFLLSILWYLKMEIPSSSLQNGRELSPRPLAPSPSPLFYWLSLAAFVLAMLSKGSVAVLPMLLLLIVWWLRPLTRRDLVRTAPFFAIAALLSGVNVWFQTHGQEEAIRSAGFVERLLGAGCVVWFYLYKALLPLNLIFIYPQWDVRAGDLSWWLPLLSAVIVTVVLWRYRKSWGRSILFAWGFFCISLAPVMGLADVYFMKYSLVADHYQYIAIIAVIALAAALWDQWRRRTRPAARLAVNCAAAVVVGMLIFLAWRQSRTFHDAITLYEATLEKNPTCWLAHNNLGSALGKAGRETEEIEHYRESLRLIPDRPEAHNNLGTALDETGHSQEAIKYFEQALQIKPDYAPAHNNLGKALLNTDRPGEAIEHFKKALQISPDFINAYNNLTSAYVKLGRSAEAIDTTRKALEIAQSKGRTDLAKQIEAWLKSYRAGLSTLPNSPPSTSSPPPP